MNYSNYNNGSHFFGIGLLLFVFFGGFKLLFALFGLALAITIQFFPFIIGGLIIYNLSKRIRKNSTINDTLHSRGKDHTQFVELSTHLIAHIITADGHIDPREINGVKQFFSQKLRFSMAQILWVEDLLQKALKKPLSISYICDECRSQYQHNDHLVLLDLLYAIASSDHHIHPNELTIIQDIVTKLQISDSEHQQIRSLYTQSKTQSQTPYDILGITPHATPSEIKSAYRNASKKYHPDKVIHLGDEFKVLAEEKMQKINDAYAQLSK